MRRPATADRFSPDGRKLLFTLVDRNRQMADVDARDRQRGRAAARRHRGLRTARSGRPTADHVGFFDDSTRKLKKLDVTTGSVTTICDAPAGRGGSWSRDNIHRLRAVEHGRPVQSPCGRRRTLARNDTARG